MVMSLMLRFAALATRMEQYIQGQSRDLVDQAYTKFVSTTCKHVIFPMITYKSKSNGGAKMHIAIAIL